MIGTLAPTILYGVSSSFVLFLGISCFVADMIYFIMLLTMYKEPVAQTGKVQMLQQT
jgi:hypothetical protein